MGYILVDKLRLPASVVWIGSVFIYFGVLLLLHNANGTSAPANTVELLSVPKGIFYYPNRIAITHDLIGNPLFILMLVVFREFIPSRICSLEKHGYIKRVPLNTRPAKLGNFLIGNRWPRLLFMVVVPLLVAFIGLIVDMIVYSPAGLPAQYGVFISFIGRYARVVIFAQLSFMFIILHQFRYDFRVQIDHPDGCSGIAPFGQLAIAGYSYIFLLAIMQALGFTAFERAFVNVGVGSMLYLWVFFPVGLTIIIGGITKVV